MRCPLRGPALLALLMAASARGQVEQPPRAFAWRAGGVYTVSLRVDAVSTGYELGPHGGPYHVIKVVSVDGSQPCALVRERQDSRERVLANPGPQVFNLYLNNLGVSDIERMEPLLSTVEPVGADEVRWCNESWTTEADERARRKLLDCCAGGGSLPGIDPTRQRLLVPPDDFELTVSSRDGREGDHEDWTATVRADRTIEMTVHGEEPRSRRTGGPTISRLVGALFVLSFFDMPEPQCTYWCVHSIRISIAVRIAGRERSWVWSCCRPPPAELRAFVALVEEAGRGT